MLYIDLSVLCSLDLVNINGEIPYNVMNKSADQSVCLPENVELGFDWRETTFKQFGHLTHLALQGLFIEMTGGKCRLCGRLITDLEDANFMKCHLCLKRVEILKDVEKIPIAAFHRADCKFVAIIKSDSEHSQPNHVISDDYPAIVIPISGNPVNHAEIWQQEETLL